MIGKIMVNLRAEAIQTANMHAFPVLDPVLSNMTDSAQTSWVHFNWGIIQRELRKFGAEMINQVKELIVGGKYEIIRDTLKFLMNFERQIKKEAKNYQKQMQMGVQPDKKEQQLLSNSHPKQAIFPSAIKPQTALNASLPPLQKKILPLSQNLPL